MTKDSTEIIVSVLNTVLLIGNIYWQWSFKKRGSEIQLMQTLTEEGKAKDEIIKDLTRDRDLYKKQYSALMENYRQQSDELQRFRKGGS